MLVYEKIDNESGKQVLYATLANVPAENDQPAVVMSGDTNITTNIIWGNNGDTPSTLIVDNGKGGFKVKVGDRWFDNCALQTADGEDIIPYEDFVAAQLAEDAAEEDPAEEPTGEPTGDAGAGEGSDEGDGADLD